MFKNLTIRTRLVFILSILVAFLLGSQMLGLFGMSNAIGGLETVYHDRAIPLKQVGYIESLLLQNRLAITSALLLPTPEIVEEKTALVEKNIERINRTWERYMLTHLTDEERKLALKFQADREIFLHEGIVPAAVALRANKIGEAHRLLVEKIRPLYRPVGASIEALVMLQLDEAGREYNREQNRYSTITNILVASIIIALLLTVLISRVFTRAISKPLENVVKIARAVAAGNLTQEIDVRSNDEVGQLMQALKEMRDSLVDTIGQVRASEAHTRALLNNMIDGIASVNQYGVIKTFNPAAELIFGYTAKEIMGQNISLLLPQQEHSQDGDAEHLKAFLARRSRAFGAPSEVAGQRKNGATFPLDLAVVEMHAEEAHMFVIIMRDISQRKLAEEQKARLMNELESANEELKSFAYVVSHDLKAPLRAIGALADWLATDYADKLDDQGKEHLRLLVSRVHRMGNLIDGILQYSRVGRVKEAPVAMDVGRVIREVIELIAPPENVTIEIEAPMPTIVAEPTRVQQIFQNLLSNAIKYMDKPRGEIRIACNDEGNQWKFSVSDNGPGIESRHYDKIFQLFQTLAPRDRIESTGVGLALVKKIVEIYGGRIWLESRPGEGSTFFFTLPKTAPIPI
ncbi:MULTISPECIES: Tar ligand binding domain-containing protein [unclassified Nitrosospira]|uniref:Tar ligand binding domain-containing protein n=1 Tax=unclassified Nitrosospira TaxID=2609267 RepID=UPI000D320DAD|nr:MULTISPECIES: Tar ligand binding domain-containing protein [unclassified Nitrosospira]PTR16471.1 PAS domain S-box-containing protein [Nitrosospira sp. Nsp2]WON73482.1 Tar ligand binding domain-containing protein [Nitrosospira sp. Is2]